MYVTVPLVWIVVCTYMFGESVCLCASRPLPLKLLVEMEDWGVWQQTNQTPGEVASHTLTLNCNTLVPNYVATTALGRENKVTEKQVLG